VTYVNIPTKFGLIEEADTMRVSKLIFLGFALLAALCFAFTPAIAEHPWSEEENAGGNGDGGELGDGGVNPDDPNVLDPDNPDLLGTDLWWLGIIWDGFTGEGDTDSAPTGSLFDTGSESSSTLEGETVQ
jgi:hypothetical protein